MGLKSVGIVQLRLLLGLVSLLGEFLVDLDFNFRMYIFDFLVGLEFTTLKEFMHLFVCQVHPLKSTLQILDTTLDVAALLDLGGNPLLSPGLGLLSKDLRLLTLLGFLFRGLEVVEEAI